MLFLTWKVSHRSFQHDKLSSFCLYYGLKRFHNPSVADVATTLGIPKRTAQRGITDMRKLVASEPSFDFLNVIELGTSNLLRKGLPLSMEQSVRKAAKENDIDLRDEKVCSNANLLFYSI